MKKFIFTSPLQKPEYLGKNIYQAEGNQMLQYDVTNSFPILSAINGYTEENEEIEIITIVIDYENAKKNYETFKEQLKEIEDRKKLKCNLVTVDIEYADGMEVQLDTLDKLLDLMEDGDELYACVTYGSKVVSIVEFMTINYAYHIKKNVTCECIVYGQKDHNADKYKVFDVTSLFYLDAVVKQLSASKNPHASEIIKKMLKEDSQDDE